MPAVADNDASPKWTVLLPAEDHLVFRGRIGLNQGDLGPGGAAYPGPALIFGLAILTHAIISQSRQDSLNKENEANANKVLQPYKEGISLLKYSEVMEQAVALAKQKDRITVAANGTVPPNSTWRIESKPVFLMAQNERGLILDNTITLYGDNPDQAVFSGVVRVVSDSVSDTAELPGHWLADGNQELKAATTFMLSRSLQMALARAGHLPNVVIESTQKTVRYLEGGVERMERATVLHETCDRAEIVNLRGWFMSVPLARLEERQASHPLCKAASHPTTPDAKPNQQVVATSS